MKKVCFTVYLLIMALLVLTMSGCGGSSSSGGGSTTTQSAQSRRMVFTSSALKRDGSYNLYRGDQVSTIEGITSKYYLAPVTRGTEDITMNLEFDSAVSQDLPFMITDSDGSTVLFYYNPKGTGIDTTTASVTRYGGSQQKLSYSNLTLTDSSVELDDSDAIDVVLNSDGTATAGGSTVPSYNYVWHALSTLRNIGQRASTGLLSLTRTHMGTQSPAPTMASTLPTIFATLQTLWTSQRQIPRRRTRIRNMLSTMTLHHQQLERQS